MKDSRYLKKMTLEDRVYETIVNNNLIKNNDKIILGVSGGPDSICMLYVLNNLKNRFKEELGINYELLVAHINHSLRDEADLETEYVKEVAKKNNIPVYVLKADIKEIAAKEKISEEMCGRNVRYDFFNKILKEEKADKIAIAHNEDDNIETILLNLSRGTGIKGLTGIMYQNEKIIRPLLDIKKAETLKYCVENNLDAKIDKSNFEAVYLRNKIRLNVIPVLKENLGEGVTDSILKTREILVKEEEFLSNYTKNIIDSVIIENNKNEMKFDIRGIINESDAIIYRSIRFLIEMCVGNLAQVSLTHIKDIAKILKERKKSKKFILGNKFEIEILNKNIAIIRKIS